MDTATVDALFQQITADDAAARGPLEAAYARATDAGTRHLIAAGALLAMSAEFADFRGLDRWVQRLLEPAPEPDHLPDRALDRARLAAAHVAVPQLDGGHALDAAPVDAAARVLFDALRQGLDTTGDETLLLAKVLHDRQSLQEDRVQCERLAALVNPSIKAGGASLAWQARWWLAQEGALAYWEPHAAAVHVREHVAELVRQGAGAASALVLAQAQLQYALITRDGPAQDRAYADIDRLRLHVRPGLALRGLYAQAMLLCRRGRHRDALDRLDLVLALCEDVEVPERDRGVYHSERAHALAGLGRWAEGLAVYDAMRAAQTGHQGHMVDVLQQVMRAAAALDQGEPEARVHVRRAVEGARAINWRRFLTALPEHASKLAAAALDAGIETAFMRAAVRERRLVPKDPWQADWPWRLRVQALGALQITRDDEPLPMPGKAPRKPLELLALLAAHGGGPLEASVAIDALWPSLEANAPRASLEMALARLRKLLDVPDAVLLTDGLLQLNPALVWVDVGAFEAACDAADRGDAPSAATALALYHAPLLGAERLIAPLQDARARLAQRHEQLVRRLSGQMHGAGDTAGALQVLQQGLRQDPECEPLYRALMQLQLQLGERAEALRTFERCRSVLQRALGVAPSDETLALWRPLAPDSPPAG